MKNVRLVLNSMIVLATGSITNLPITTRILIQVREDLNRHGNPIRNAQTHM